MYKGPEVRVQGSGFVTTAQVQRGKGTEAQSCFAYSMLNSLLITGSNDRIRRFDEKDSPKQWNSEPMAGYTISNLIAQKFPFFLCGISAFVTFFILRPVGIIFFDRINRIEQDKN